MKDIFRSRTFIAMCILAVMLIGMMAVSAADRGRVTIFEDIAGMILTPLQSAVTTVSQKSGDFIAIFTEHNELKEENEKLKTELAKAAQAIRNADIYKQQNESLSQMLGIKQKRTDFVFESALIVANDQSGYSHTLTLNKGSASGVKKRDVVITAEGIIGYVSELGTTWCKVITILDSNCELGALITRTQDIGVAEGDFSLATSGNCKLSYLPNDVEVNSGDSVVTSGIGGVFPSGIMIGNVVELKPESHGISQYAVIEPAVDFAELKNVFIVTAFDESAAKEAN